MQYILQNILKPHSSLAASFLLIWAILLGQTAVAIPTRDLREFDEDKMATLPLLLKPTHGISSKYTSGSFMVSNSILLADIDLDDRVDYLRAGAYYVIKYNVAPPGDPLIQDQLNFPRKYDNEDNHPSFNLSGPFDLAGDGIPKFVAMTVHSQEGQRTAWVVDGPTMEIESSFTLGEFPQRRPDKIWDGHYEVIGTVMGLLPDPKQAALILSLTVGFDANGRGIMAVNPRNGDILWHFTCGPNPHPKFVQVADINGDGANEIIFLGRSPDNLDPGELIGNYGDDHSRLFVLDHKGNEIWSRKLEEKLSIGQFRIGDIDSRPGLEIITTSHRVSEAPSHLRTWSAAGEMLAEKTFPTNGVGLRLLPGTTQGSMDILASFRDGTITRLTWNGRDLKPQDQARLNSMPHLYEPFFHPDSGKILIPVIDQKRGYWLLDRNLKPMAALSDTDKEAQGELLPWQDQGLTYLILLSYGQPGFSVISNPDALPANALARFILTRPMWVWLLGIVLLATAVLWRRTHLKHRQDIEARAVIPGDRDHLREARLHLLEDLELSGHGAIAPLRSFRRLLWLLDALQSGMEFNEEMGSRFREIWQDCHQDDLPRLLVILDRARAAQMDHHCIDQATVALQKIQLILARFRKADFAEDVLRSASDELHHLGTSTEEALQKLRGEVAELFTADLRQVVDKVLRANEADIESAGIKVHLGLVAAAQGGSDQQIPVSQESLLCRMDPTELGFILDNLTGNAVRAMSDSAIRDLRLTWQPTNGLVKLEISDTGVGIDDEDMDLILESPYSTRQGGGLGLPKSVRILRKYGGSMKIKTSSPGQGTTFQVLVPRAH